MENKTEFNEIAYKKAKKRVKEITNYYWFVAVYAVVAAVLLLKDHGDDDAMFSNQYVILLVVLQGVLLLGYGLYLFVPALHGWEDRKTKELMKKYEQDER